MNDNEVCGRNRNEEGESASRNPYLETQSDVNDPKAEASENEKCEEEAGKERASDPIEEHERENPESREQQREPGE
jgi:hypothetical protein